MCSLNRTQRSEQSELPTLASETDYRAFADEVVTEGFIPAFRTTTSATTEPTSSENKVNQARMQAYRKELSGRLLALIAECDFEYGFSSALDSFLRERLAENAFVTREWLNSLFVEHFEDVGVLTGVLRTIAHLDYYDVAPEGPTMALAALSHSSIEVRESGIRAFENWATADCLGVLRNVECAEQWMQDYVAQVVRDLEEELGLHGATC